MRVLVACEFSGVVRDAFIARGHEAVSCDLLDSERPGPHVRADVLSVLHDGWDMMIAFPPCTYLTRSGAWRHWNTDNQIDALDFVRLLLDAPIDFIALENPIGAINSRVRKPDQIIHPYQFGHAESKATCLWLKNLPPLTSTRIEYGRAPRPNTDSFADRWKHRSRMLPGIAAAMASQWGTQ